MFTRVSPIVKSRTYHNLVNFHLTAVTWICVLFTYRKVFNWMAKESILNCVGISVLSSQLIITLSRWHVSIMIDWTSILLPWITHLITDTRPAALSIICHGTVESNIASRKSLVFAVRSDMFVTVYERTWNKKKWQRWCMINYQTLTTVESARVKFSLKRPTHIRGHPLVRVWVTGMWDGAKRWLQSGWPKIWRLRGGGSPNPIPLRFSLGFNRNYTVTMEPCLTAKLSIWPPRYYGHFIPAWAKPW